MNDAERKELETKLAEVGAMMIAQEALRGKFDDRLVEAALAPLREREAVLQAQLRGDDSVDWDDNAKMMGTRGVDATEADVDGSIISGKVRANNYAGRDMTIHLHTAEAATLFWEQWGKPAPDLQKAMARYLSYLAGRYLYLDFKGMGAHDQIPLRLPLAEMYVPLNARIEMPKGETWARELKLAGRQVSEEEADAIGRRLSEPQPVLNLALEKDGLIILGDPGAGKTTFLKYLALQLALGKDIGLGARLPVLVPLAAYANALAEEDIPLHRFIASYYEGLGIDEPLTAMLAEALDRGGVLLLLDGLDEVQQTTQRHLVIDRVLDFFAYRREQGNKFLLTSRIVGYRDVRPSSTDMATWFISPKKHLYTFLRQVWHT